MSTMSSADEIILNEQKAERKKTLIKFARDLKISYSIWIKIGGIISGSLILSYLFTRFIIGWDLFYETDLNYTMIFLIITVLFFVFVSLCWFGAFFLYNTKHRRNTKYKSQSIERGGTAHGKKT